MRAQIVSHIRPHPVYGFKMYVMAESWHLPADFKLVFGKTGGMQTGIKEVADIDEGLKLVEKLKEIY